MLSLNKKCVANSGELYVKCLLLKVQQTVSSFRKSIHCNQINGDAKKTFKVSGQ